MDTGRANMMFVPFSVVQDFLRRPYEHHSLTLIGRVPHWREICDRLRPQPFLDFMEPTNPHSEYDAHRRELAWLDRSLQLQAGQTTTTPSTTPEAEKERREKVEHAKEISLRIFEERCKVYFQYKYVRQFADTYQTSLLEIPVDQGGTPITVPNFSNLGARATSSISTSASGHPNQNPALTGLASSYNPATASLTNNPIGVVVPPSVAGTRPNAHRIPAVFPPLLSPPPPPPPPHHHTPSQNNPTTWGPNNNNNISTTNVHTGQVVPGSAMAVPAGIPLPPPMGFPLGQNMPIAPGPGSHFSAVKTTANTGEAAPGVAKFAPIAAPPPTIDRTPRAGHVSVAETTEKDKNAPPKTRGSGRGKGRGRRGLTAVTSPMPITRANEEYTRKRLASMEVEERSKRQKQEQNVKEAAAAAAAAAADGNEVLTIGDKSFTVSIPTSRKVMEMIEKMGEDQGEP